MPRIPRTLLLALCLTAGLERGARASSASIASFSSIRLDIPLVVNTWAFTNATKTAWKEIAEGKSSLDAVERGCTTCEDEQCDGTVGFGGSPDESGETTLDALIFDGDTMDMGAVGGLRRVKHAASVARRVLENTEHSILVGDLATKFARRMGFKVQSLATNESRSLWMNWRKEKCQPNYWKNVKPDPRKFCGPYKPLKEQHQDEFKHYFSGIKNHDTISMIAIDRKGSIAAGTSSNGSKFKVPGRVGDAPLPGAGAYADSTVGGAVATGDGDIMMRFLPTSNLVEMMRQGVDPQIAATKLIFRIAKYYPTFSGALLAVSNTGKLGAACHGFSEFPVAVAQSGRQIIVIKFLCFNSTKT